MKASFVGAKMVQGPAEKKIIGVRRIRFYYLPINNKYLGSGCGSVGRAFAFDTRGPRFNCSHRQYFIEHLFIINFIEKTKLNKKRPGMAHFFLKQTNKQTNPHSLVAVMGLLWGPPLAKKRSPAYSLLTVQFEFIALNNSIYSS